MRMIGMMTHTYVGIRRVKPPDGNRYYYVTKSGKVYACRDRYGRSTITYVYHWKPRESYLTEVTDEVESREVYRKLAEKHPEYAVFTL